MMQVIKLTTPWGHTFLKDQLDPQTSAYKFEIDNDCNECDYWVIWGDITAGEEKLSVKCPVENIIYMTDEAHEKKMYNQAFLNQYNYLLTCRDDLTHKNLIRTHEINHWHLGKTLAEVNNRELIAKTKSLSVVCSDLTILNGHKKRYALVNKLIGHFKDRIDVFGRGFNPIDDKWDALAPYKYSVAIENSAVPGYFTEKLSECYLAHTLPIYYGAPDIANYFDPASMLTIEIDDYKACINSIEKLLQDDPWQQLQSKLIDQKLIYLNNYHLFPGLIKVIEQLPKSSSKTTKQTIYGHDTFYPRYRLRKLYVSVKSLLFS
jgi:hypothetical protein